MECCCWRFISTKSQYWGLHWASELYEPIIAKWKEENQQEFAYLAKEQIVKNPIEILKNSMNETTKPYYGVVVKPFHFTIANSSTMEFLNQSFLLNFTYFILIRRKNSLRIIVSDKVARKKNTWHSCGEDIAKLEKIHLPLNQHKPLVKRILETIRLPLNQHKPLVKRILETIRLPLNQHKPLVKRIRNSEKQMQEVETLLAGKNVLNLTYEDDIEQDPQKAYRSICEFVNMEATKASVNYNKTNPFPLKDIIENFAEVKAALHNTPYEWMPNS